MTDPVLPATGTLVELTAADEPLRGVRVVTAGAGVVTLSLPLADIPARDAAVTLRWPAGARGRYAAGGTVVAVDGNRVDVAVRTAPLIEQHRNFVRGGGGEPVLLLRPGAPEAPGWIRDISERGVRAHFADVEPAEGERIRLRMQLDPDVMEVDAVAAKVARLRQSVPRRGPMSVEVVAVLSVPEAQARVIRRYVLRQQLLTRSRTTG